jgi:hypothetical protein
MERWLEPDVQVPKPQRKLLLEAGTANLQLAVLLYAQEPKVLEEEPPAPEAEAKAAPGAKAKGKK